MTDFDKLLFKYCVYHPAVLLQGQNVHTFLRSLNETQWLPSSRLAEIQTKKLDTLVAFAKLAVPHYQKALRDISVSGGFSRDDVRFLPFLRKADLQRDQSPFLRPQGTKGLAAKTTGGSTGQAVTIWKTSEAVAQEHAANWRGFGWAGIDIGDRQARLWGLAYDQRGRFRARIADFVANRKRCSAFSFDERDMREYTRQLNRFRPRYVYGYVSMLTAYAEHLKSSGDRLRFDLRAVVPTSEVLTSYHRRLFEEAYGAPVFNEYGCGELGTIAHECERGSMHINAENLLVEILNDDDKPCSPLQTGEIVITELNNTGMPLIRYRLGDYAAFSNTSCPCGRTLPVIENIAGRAYDLICNREGKMFHGEFFMYIFEEVQRKKLGIRSFQVIQLDFDQFVVKVVPGDGYGAETERLVRSRIADGYGSRIEVNFVQVPEIFRERSGKMRLIVGMKSAKRLESSLAQKS